MVTILLSLLVACGFGFGVAWRRAASRQTRVVDGAMMSLLAAVFCLPFGICVSHLLVAACTAPTSAHAIDGKSPTGGLMHPGGFSSKRDVVFQIPKDSLCNHLPS